MMHVPVDDKHLFKAPSLLGIARRDCNIIEKTKSHGLVHQCMMTGRTDGHKGPIKGPTANRINPGQTSAGGQLGRLLLQLRLEKTEFVTDALIRAADEGVGIQLHQTILFSRFFCVFKKMFDISRAVNVRDFFFGGAARCQLTQILIQGVARYGVINSHQPLRRFGMALRRNMLQKALIAHESQS